MPDYRRLISPGGTYFFTLVTYRRRPIFAESSNVQLLRDVMRALRDSRPFTIVAAVVMPDHLHFIWTLPEADSDYSSRIGQIKVMFTKAFRQSVGWASPTNSFPVAGGRSGGQCPPYVCHSRRKHRESDVWQRRFWEHKIRDERDMENHLNYIHYNPVKHGLATCPHAWEASSFRQWVSRGDYEENWCCCCNDGNVKLPYPETLEVGE